MDDWACLVDTNILLRMSRQADPHYASIRMALIAVRKRPSRLCYTSQILGEFWNTATRPLDKNGFGLNIQQADELVREIERDFEFLPDSQAVHERWRRLIVEHEVRGVQVHDARIAASLYVHDIPLLLTLNVRDFARFRGLDIVHPADVGQ